MSRTITCGHRFILGGASFGIYYQSSFRQEFIYHIYCLVHETAAVASQIDDELLCALALQIGQGCEEFRVGVAGKLTYLYISDVVVDNICGINTITWYLATNDIKRKGLSGTTSLYDQLNFGSFLTAQCLEYILG